MLQAFAFAAMAGSSLLSAYGSMKAGESALDAARLNADRYQWLAGQSKKMTAINLYRHGRYADDVRGSQITAIAKSGGSLDDPTSAAILRDTAENAALDEWLIKYQGMMEATGMNMQANNALYEGRMAKASGRVQAFSTLLGGAGDLYTGYKTLNPGKAE